MAYESDLAFAPSTSWPSVSEPGLAPGVGTTGGGATRAAGLDARLRDASPEQIIAAAIDAFPGRVAVASSFGAESAVLLHLLSRVDPATPVLFLDTGQLFGQTLDYRKALAERLGLRDVRDLRPAYADLATVDPGADLYKTDTDACCAIRKVAPLDGALKALDAWITGRKRFQGVSRLRLPVVEEAEGKLKFNPLAGWDKARLEAYADRHGLPAHPLVVVGYGSIGCWPCTKPTGEGQDERAGRWAGSEKTECGIHTPRTPSSAPSGEDVGGGI
jgi:phosphoadenosine phosphosulfate reductase